MGPTPLCDALRAFSAQGTLRLHMPGHKGKDLPLPELGGAAALDFTELPPTGDLFSGDGPIREAERLWARAFGMDECLFLTGGSTQGVLSALALSTKGGGSAVLLDRGSHRAAYNALALLDLDPAYLVRPWLDRAEIFGPVSPQSVENALKERPEIKTVCIVSPTYYGVLSDIPAIAHIVHAHGGKLVVDAAHGAHLPFLGDRRICAADLVVASAHKTLPALGQSALLFSGNGAFSHAELRGAGSLFGSSSPSYVLMASLDAARAWMEDEGGHACRRAATGVARLREKFPAVDEQDAPLDPMRFVLQCGDGFGVQAALEEQGVYPEMADSRHTVFIHTGMDGSGDFERLEQAIERAAAARPASFARSPLAAGKMPPEAEVALSPRAARLGPSETVALRNAAERVCASQVAPYPPGIPVLAPGERIGKKHLAYLAGIGYNMEEDIQVVP